MADDGAELEADRDTPPLLQHVICHDCAHENLPLIHFCEKCGNPLTALAVIAPLEFPPGINGPPMPVSMGAVLIREDGEWRVLVMSMLADDMAPLGDPEVDAVFEAMAETLEPFGQQIGESILSGDPEAFLDLCLPEGIVAGPWGPENAPMAARVADVQDGTADLPKLGLVVGEANPQEGVRLLGMGCAWMAVNTIVKDAAGELKPARHTAICVFDAEEGTWSVLAGIEAAREE